MNTSQKKKPGDRSANMPQTVASIGNQTDPDYVAVELTHIDPQGGIYLVAHTPAGIYALSVEHNGATVERVKAAPIYVAAKVSLGESKA